MILNSVPREVHHYMWDAAEFLDQAMRVGQPQLVLSTLDFKHRARIGFCVGSWDCRPLQPAKPSIKDCLAGHAGLGLQSVSWMHHRAKRCAAHFSMQSLFVHGLLISRPSRYRSCNHERATGELLQVGRIQTAP